MGPAAPGLLENATLLQRCQQLCRNVSKPESLPTERENTPVRHWHTVCIKRWRSITISNFLSTNHFKSYKKSGAGEIEAFAEHWTFDELKMKLLVWGICSGKHIKRWSYRFVKLLFEGVRVENFSIFTAKDGRGLRLYTTSHTGQYKTWTADWV